MNQHIAIFVIEKLEVVSTQALNTHVKCKKTINYLILWQDDNDVVLMDYTT